MALFTGESVIDAFVPFDQGNEKFVIPLGDVRVEAVWYGSGTLCLSSQAGCAVGCPFCASGARGLRRNLSPSELEAQLEWALARGFEPRRLTLSGVGEPLHNAPAVLSFLDRCRSLNLPLSLTTTGGPLARLEEFVALPHNGLVLSLHAGRGDTHRRLVPRGPALEELWDCFAAGLGRLSRRRRRKMGVNYLLLAGVNDSEAELEAFARRLEPHPEITVHLLVCNPVPGSPYGSPPLERVAEVAARWRSRGLNVRLANRWRRQARGGCGTLLADPL